jgi:hypothetical protein
MDKSQLQSIIQKYHINGLVEQVLWNIADKEINIHFMTSARDVIGHLIQKNIDLPDSEIAIYSTSQLLKLLNILNKDIILDLEQTNSVYTKLRIQDQEYNLYFTLANPMIIENVGKVNEPQEYDVILPLSSEQMFSFIKARNALSKDTTNVKITTTKDFSGANLIQFEMGNLSNYSNKISFSFPAKINQPVEAVFNSDIIKDIFQVNKDIDKCIISIKNEGLMKIEFSTEETQIKYFTIKNS